jgi:hypothetical protein
MAVKVQKDLTAFLAMTRLGRMGIGMLVQAAVSASTKVCWRKFLSPPDFWSGPPSCWSCTVSLGTDLRLDLIAQWAALSRLRIVTSWKAKNEI